MKIGFSVLGRLFQPRSGVPAISLVEVLVSLGIFSVAIVGIYIGMQTMRTSLITTMRRSVEASAVNMKLAEINPNNPAIETAYDITTKTAQSLSDGDSFFYTRIVDSTGTTPDIKNVNVYLYRSSTASSAYRIFKREIAPFFMAYNLGEATTYTRDSVGRVWAPFSITAASFVSTTGSRQNGSNRVHANIDGTALCATVTGTQDTALFNKQQESNNGANTLEYKLFSTLGRYYTVRLATTELVNGTVAGNRKMDVTINGTLQGTLDPISEAGATCAAIVKDYTVTPADSGSGVGVITVTLTRSSGATLNPRLSGLALIRSTL